MSSNGDTPAYDDLNPETNRINRASDQDNDVYPLLPAYSQNSSSSGKPTYKKAEITIDKNGEPTIALAIDVVEVLSKNVPTILEGFPLTGALRLDLDSPNPISSVTITVEGKYNIGGVTGLEKTIIFLKHNETLWSQDKGEPPNSATDSSILTSGSAYKGPLQGEYTWPIFIKLPEEVKLVVARESTARSFILPQTFHEKFIRATVEYTVSARIVRFGLLKEDYQLLLPLGYMRVTRPPELSLLRQVAYQEHTEAPGPSIDPEGWYCPESVQVRGNLFKVEEFVVECAMYVAKPLAYTAGTFIPLCLRLESDNERALDLLSATQVIHARVRRQIIDHSQANNIVDNGSFRASLDYSQRAVWWKSDESPTAGRVRLFNGELHLKPGMKPNAQLGDFKLSYSVMLYGFNAVGVEFQEQKFLQEVPIQICTFHGPGPRPRPTTTFNCEPDVPYAKLIVPYMNEYSKGFY